MRLICISVVLYWGASVSAQEITSIPDPFLENAIRPALGIRSKTLITGAMLLRMREALDIDSNRISDIGPLHELESLNELDIHSNRARDFISLLGMPDLDFVNLQANGLDLSSPPVASVINALQAEVFIKDTYPQTPPKIISIQDADSHTMNVWVTPETENPSYRVEQSGDLIVWERLPGSAVSSMKKGEHRVYTWRQNPEQLAVFYRFTSNSKIVNGFKTN